MDTLSICDAVRNAAAVFSGIYGAVTGRARQAGCSRQAVYEQARQIGRRLQAHSPTTPPVEAPVPPPTPSFDGPTRRHFAVTAFAMGISTRQIEGLLRICLGGDAPDHLTIARWVADAAREARPLLQALDAACIPRVRTLALDEVFFGGDRPWSASSPRA